MTRTSIAKLGGGVELRITRHEGESITMQRVIGSLTMPPAPDQAQRSGLLHDRFRIVITPAEAKQPSRF